MVEPHTLPPSSEYEVICVEYSGGGRERVGVPHVWWETCVTAFPGRCMQPGKGHTYMSGHADVTCRGHRPMTDWPQQ